MVKHKYTNCCQKQSILQLTFGPKYDPNLDHMADISLISPAEFIPSTIFGFPIELMQGKA